MDAPRKHTASRPIEYLLSGISSTSSIITRFIRSVRASHSDLSAVTRELSDLRLLLELLRDEPHIPLVLQAQMLLLLESCGNTLIRIDSILAQCHDATQWAQMGKAQMAQCRDDLGLFREALAMALDIVSLDPKSSQSNPSEAEFVTESIMGEVERLRKHSDSAVVDQETRSVLVLYLDAVANCLRQSQPSSPAPARPNSEEFRNSQKPSNADAAGLEAGIEALCVAQTTPVPTSKQSPEQNDTGEPAQPQPRPLKPHEDADKWNTSRTNAYSYYSGQPDSIDVIRPEDHQPSPPLPPLPPQPLPESPTIPGQSETRTPVSHRNHPPPLNREAWTHDESPSTKSDPFGDGRSYLEIDSPTFPPDRWSEPVQGSQGYPEQESRAASTPTSTTTGNSPRSTMSPHRAPSTISSVSRFRPDSPGLQSNGKATPASSMLSLFPRPTEYGGSSTPKVSGLWANGMHSPPLFTPSLMSPSTLAPSMKAPSIMSASQLTIPAPAKHSPYHGRLKISSSRHLTDKKGKASEILHIDISPASMFITTKHTNKLIKIWSIPKGNLHCTVKITSYVTPQVRSREYFIRSHSMLSENANLIGITTHFGLTLDIYNFTKGGTSAKKVQVIEEAHRWAASKRDAYHTHFAPLVVYRPKGDRIDRYFLARHPSAKKPFWEDTTRSIEFLKAGLPFIPKFPELAFSSDSPFLVAAAGPRPGDAPRANAIILIAWMMQPTSDSKLNARTPNATVTSLEDTERHKPYRVNIPDYPALQTALPASLIAHGSQVVSIWIPAGHQEVAIPGGTYKRHPVPASERFILVWDLPANTTRIFSIPNVQACISPDCIFVAYNDANAGQFVVVDIPTSEEIWRWPDAGKGSESASFGQLEDLHKITVFEFSPDGKMLVVGDSSGNVGVYDIKAGETRYELGDGTEMALVDMGVSGRETSHTMHSSASGSSPAETISPGAESRFSSSSLYVPLGWQGDHSQVTRSELPS
ncbi:hypothetical protein QBC35DRAFT_465413 [Podospora australis]|uniref:Uncharacterized protein n=1 Tax=Podospora australis TaxID=1536484 RepID=A0AAN6WPF8_9PEZI|nr:hypothetical protein QBC35DRAFT_465413 [Podospora australis]